MSAKGLKGLIIKARVKLFKAQTDLTNLLLTCVHEYEETKYGGSRCKICEEGGDWW